MRIIVVGAGTVGSSIASYLSRDRHDVIVIDANHGRLSSTEEEMDVQVLAGNGCEPATLRTAGAPTADLLLAVTEKDETNLICAYTAKRLGCRRVVARVRSRFYDDTNDVNFKHPLGIDLLISPEISTASELATFVSFPNALALTTMARGRVQLRTLKLAPDSAHVGKQVRSIAVPSGVLIASIRRENQVMIARGNTTLEAHDRVTLIGVPEVLDKATEAFDRQPPPERFASIVIAGAGETGMYLAELLENRGHEVTIIERDRHRADYVSERLRRTRILLGDATEALLLREERIGRADYFIGLTGDDESNIMSSLVAKELGVQKTACLIDRPDYARIVEKIGINVAISPRFVVANRVLALIKRGRISSVTLLEDGELEATEYQALSRSAVVGQPLRDIVVPPTGLIGAVLQSNQLTIPRGDYVIQPGSTVITLSLTSEAEAMDALFAGSEG